jgi:hypothetical protein
VKEIGTLKSVFILASSWTDAQCYCRSIMILSGVFQMKSTFSCEGKKIPQFLASAISDGSPRTGEALATTGKGSLSGLALRDVQKVVHVHWKVALLSRLLHLPSEGVIAVAGMFVLLHPHPFTPSRDGKQSNGAEAQCEAARD